MKQGLLAFQYEEEKSTTGMTALSGLMTYVELMHVAGLRSSVERRVGLRGGGQGWTDSQIITSLILLNLAGGESVMDLEVLEKDAGLCRVLRHAETHGMRRRERRALKARWRGERWRSVPSDSVVFRYLERFHDAGEEAKRVRPRTLHGWSGSWTILDKLPPGRPSLKAWAALPQPAGVGTTPEWLPTTGTPYRRPFGSAPPCTWELGPGHPVSETSTTAVGRWDAWQPAGGEPCSSIARPGTT